MKQKNVFYASVVLALSLGSSAGVYLSHHQLNSGWEDLRSSKFETLELKENVEARSHKIISRENSAADLQKNAQQLSDQSLQAISESQAHKNHATQLQRTLENQISESAQAQKQAELARSRADDASRSAKREADKSSKLQSHYADAQVLATAAEKESLAAKSQYQTSHSRSLREFDKLKNERVNLAKLQQDVQYQMDDAEALSAQANQVIGEHNALEGEISSLENDVCQLKSELSTRNTNIHHHRQRLHNLESEKNRLRCQLDAEHSKNNSLESKVRSLQSKLNSRATSSNSHSPRMPKAHVTHQKKRVASAPQTNRLNISKAKLDSFRSKNITLRR